MGNVSAAEGKKSASPPPPPMMSPPPSKPGGNPTVDRTPAPSTPLERNPGLYEDLHKQCKGKTSVLFVDGSMKIIPIKCREIVKELFPQVFEGAKVIIAKGISSHFQVSHTMNLSTFTPSGYRFGATYIGTKQLSPTEAYPVLLGDIDSNGNMSANILHAFSERLKGKFVTQFQNRKCAGQQFTLDYKGDTFSSSLIAGNLDPLNLSGLVIAHYLQRITPRLALGAELMYQRGPQIPGGEVAIMSLAGRYSGEKWTLSANLSPVAGNLHTCYYQRVHESLQVGVEIETSVRMQESTATIGYQIDIPKADVVFKGQFDSNWCVGGVMEKKLVPFPFTLAFSGYANHVKNQYRFGIGIIVG